MRHEWKSFKITLILYTIVFILPLVFSFVHYAFDTMRSDTKIVRQSSWIGGAIEAVILDPKITINSFYLSKIDTALNQVSSWVAQNNDSNYYIGTKTLSEDFYQINMCWNDIKKFLDKNDFSVLRSEGVKCWNTTNHFSIIVEKMVYLKQNKIINSFYLSLLLMMLFTIILIYFVRAYIDSQLKKHAIYDLETNLFNKKYLMSQLDILCARSVRTKEPLSILSLYINVSETERKSIRKHVFEMFGGLIISLTRTSDVACRYDSNIFSILLPETNKQNALILENRIRETLINHDFMTQNKVEFKFSTIVFDTKETKEELIERTRNESIAIKKGFHSFLKIFAKTFVETKEKKMKYGSSGFSIQLKDIENINLSPTISIPSEIYPNFYSFSRIPIGPSSFTSKPPYTQSIANLGATLGQNSILENIINNNK
ncbi:MAG TPA: diguanylate cyclase, partial [Hydrogenothermaceae bacterium]|nr:diguanylate cyclase [Hydrogenothermaceae bacterium]